MLLCTIPGLNQASNLVVVRASQGCEKKLTGHGPPNLSGICVLEALSDAGRQMTLAELSGQFRCHGDLQDISC